MPLLFVLLSARSGADALAYRRNRHRFKQGAQRPRTIITYPIDEKCGCSVYAASDAAHKIFSQPRGISAGLNLGDQPTRVQLQRRCISDQVFIFERILVLKQNVVHHPKFSLPTGCFGGLGRVFGMWMNIGQRKVAISETQVIAQTFLNRFDHWEYLTASRAFVVTVLQEGHWSIERALNVVASGNRNGQPRCRNIIGLGAFHLVSFNSLERCDSFAAFLFCRSSNADKTPFAPGFTPTGET